MLDPWPLQPFEPVAYFDFGWSVELTGSISWRKPWKYVKLVPTGFKTTAKNSFPQERFNSYPIEFQFFGVCGDEVESTVDFTEYSNGVTLPHNIQNVCKTGYSFNVEVHVWTQQQTLDNDETDPSREDKVIDSWFCWSQNILMELLFHTIFRKTSAKVRIFFQCWSACMNTTANFRQRWDWSK